MNPSLGRPSLCAISDPVTHVEGRRLPTFDIEKLCFLGFGRSPAPLLSIDWYPTSKPPGFRAVFWVSGHLSYTFRPRWHSSYERHPPPTTNTTR